ncbi:uncharacterized protein isoform X2 [Choristoneura fumiferana]|uniref:uncharacterized protein isoform X2 n=1 Tax=Choristoneura fumiferana TaxID=7141 RepID=UPI003D15C100
MKVILTFIILIVCGVSNSYGDITATFMINTATLHGTETAYCESNPKKVTLEEGSQVRIETSNYNHIQYAACDIPNHPKEFDTPRNNDDNKDAWYLRLPNVSVNESGRWSCELKFNGPGSGLHPNPDGYTMVHCEIDVTVTKRIIPGAGEKGRSAGDGDISNSTIFIIVGVIVTLIIFGQSIALLYFKSRGRYSAPPSRRNTKTNRAAAETDSHIYEMVGVNALYKDSSELDIKNRPPLPLPGESPVPPPVPIDTLPRPPKSKLMSSTLSLNSISSKPVPASPVKKELPPTPVTTLNKAPCRPPKPTDVDSLTGSLPRPPKPGSLPRPPKPGTSLPRPPKPGTSLPRPPKPGTSLPRPPKPGTSLQRPPKPSGSMPKILPTDPGLLELKNALAKRNVKNATSPSPSQQSTLEMKKTPTKTPPPPTLAKPAKTPAGAINPLSPNMKLVMPKIEASLKPAKKPEAALPRTNEPIPGGPSLQPVKPGVPPFRRPNAEFESNASTVTPLIPPQTQAKSRPLPPIHTEEDETHYSDDEEWTYEQLEQYNIYNV